MENEFEVNPIETKAADEADVTDLTETVKTKRTPKVAAPKPNWTPGEIVSVALKHLEIAEDKNDPLFDVRGLEEADSYLTGDIKEDGFNSVIWAVERTPGTLTIIAGRRRFKAAEEARKKEVEVKIFDPTLDAFGLISLMIKENARRLEDTSINKARKAQRMLDAYIERIRPKDEGIKQDDNGEIEYTGDAWRPSKKQINEGIEEVAKAFGFKSGKRVKDQLLPLVEMSMKVQKALEKGQIAEAVALGWKDDTHEAQERKLERALEKAAESRVSGKGSTRNADGKYPTLQFKRPALEEARVSLRKGEISAPKAVSEFLETYLGYVAMEDSPKWIQKLFDWEPEEEGEK